MLPSVIKLPSQRLIFVCIVILCFISRLPQLTSLLLILDGDECVVGIMAKHTMQGKYFPMFFLGQRYGLCTLEVLTIIPFYWVFGITTLAVKCAMLSLWATGIIFFYKALTKINKKNPWIPVVIILMFIFTPAWAVWAMKARGGYISAFVLSSIAAYLLVNERLNKKNSTDIWLGILLVLIYECQMLWMPALLPLYLYYFIRDKRWKKLALSIIAALITFLLFYTYQQTLPEPVYVIKPYAAPEELVIWIIERIPDYFFTSLHGRFFFNFAQQPDFYGGVAAALFTIFIFVLLVCSIVFLFSKKKRGLLSLLILLAIPGMAYLTTLTYTMEYRYLLPVTGIALLGLVLLFNTINVKGWMIGLCCLFIVLSAKSLTSFHDFAFSDTFEYDFVETMNTLDKEGVHYLFSPNDFTAWQVNFYSNERIICRPKDAPGRYPEYLRRVDEQLFKGGKTAVFNTNNFANEYKWEFDSMRIVGTHYYLCEYPDPYILKKTFAFINWPDSMVRGKYK